jgi:hypothetical protein
VCGHTDATLVTEEQVLVPHHANKLRLPRQHLRSCSQHKLKRVSIHWHGICRDFGLSTAVRPSSVYACSSLEA